MPLLKKVIGFISRHFNIFLILVVLISFGQMLWMQVWEDDHALFFKLAHIKEGAGYFGEGPFGVGVYSYAATPFIPIYWLFGHRIEAYFGFLLLLYVITTLFVYKVFSKILGETSGKVAGFLYAAGYIASDGVWRMANSATSSISLVVISLFLICYWKFYKDRKLFFYFLALFFYFLGVEFEISRMHYFIAVVVLIEFIFFAFKKPVGSLIAAIVRLAPFVIICVLKVASSDPRGVFFQDFVLAIFRLDFLKYFGFISSVGNLVFPDWLTNLFSEWDKHSSVGAIRPTVLFLITLPGIIFWLTLKGNSLRKVLLPLFLLVTYLWAFLAKGLFSTPTHSLAPSEYFVLALGGYVLIFAALTFLLLKKGRDLFLFLFLWMLINISIFSAVSPQVVLPTIHRYFSHSFFALVGILALLFSSFEKKKILGKLGKGLIIIFGITNIMQSVTLENNILLTRSFPVKKFFEQFSSYVSEVKRGDVFYFDVSDSSQHYYRHAIATAQMPETTAIAWRYEIDRYDLKLTNDFGELLKIVEEDKTPAEKIHTFFYLEKNLVDTSYKTREFLEGNSKDKIILPGLPISSNEILTPGELGTTWKQEDIILNIEKPVDSEVPTKVRLLISATAARNLTFPLTQSAFSLDEVSGVFWTSDSERMKAFDYQNLKKKFIDSSTYAVSSEWQNRRLKNVSDSDPESVWQSDRTVWGEEKTFIQIALPELEEVSKVVWLAGSARNFPVAYEIEISEDGGNFRVIKSVYDTGADPTKPQVVNFEPVYARFIRMIITQTLNTDSPMVAEFWPVSSRHADLDIIWAEDFLGSPLSYVDSDSSFNQTLKNVGGKGKIKVYWLTDKSNLWQTNENSKIDVVYNGKAGWYKIMIPASGDSLLRLRISDFSFPGTVNLENAEISH